MLQCVVAEHTGTVLEGCPVSRTKIPASDKCEEISRRGCTNPAPQFAMATKYCTVANNIFGLAVWTLYFLSLFWLPGF